jgi:hypothetical protein
VDVTDQVESFRRSVTTILLSEHDFIDWDAVGKAVASSERAARMLQAVCDEGALTTERLARALGEHPEIYDVALSLVAFNASGSQMSKWGLGAIVPSTVSGREHVARQLLHIGLERVVGGATSVGDMLRVAEVYKDSFRRRFRSGDRFSGEIVNLMRKALAQANGEMEMRLEQRNDVLADTNLRRSLEYVVAIEGRPHIGVATVFQNQSGGRQQRDLTVTYPMLQQRLSEYGMALVLIADGQGMSEASDRTLVQLFEGVRYPMTLKQAQAGALKNAFLEAARKPLIETLDAAAISRLISGALSARDAISASELPLSNGPAVLALARFAESNRNLALALSSTGDTLSWNDPMLVRSAGNLEASFDDRQALNLLAQCIGSTVERVQIEGSTIWSMLAMPDTPPFTGRLLVAAHSSGLTADVRQSISRLTLQHAPGSAFAVLLAGRDLTEVEVESHRKRQGALPTNIVLVGPKLIRRLARSADPLQALNEAVLDQSDLTKVSPFILSNATPTRMFFGRAAEAATILGTVGTNSVALLGSRRIGKTSLLRHVRVELSESNFLPFFGDCQTVRTWQDFADLARAQWGVATSDNFRPRNLAALVRELGAGSDKSVVIILDEIDQLLDWDRHHNDDSVPEAFFRACRSLSQEGLAQFIFSGERTIAQRIWDPESPHWNFCRPLSLAQLTRDAATALLIQPLRSIGVTIVDEVSFGMEAWRLTSGHPQIVQHLGDRLVRRLDAKSNRRALELRVADIVGVAETYEFAEHYLNTYWGQANALEREISLMVAKEPIAPNDLLRSLRDNHPALDERTMQAAVRMLQLYGLIAEAHGLISLRASWFSEAQSYFGGRAPLAGGA